MPDPHIIGLYIVDAFLLAGIFYLCYQSKNSHNFSSIPFPENNDDNYSTFSNEDNV
tara:strand:+ start:449 stop:616 length:168 start_codon:yes stop_codon:yes gene_type:complete